MTPNRSARSPSPAGLRARIGSLLLACACIAAAPVLAADGSVAVRAAYFDLDEGVYYLNASVDYNLGETAHEALRNGVKLTLELQIEVNRRWRWRPDVNVADLRQRYTLQFHALSERYVLRNVNTGDQLSYGSLNAAMDALGDVRRLPVVDAALLQPGKRYEAGLRAVVDIRKLPVPLRLFGRFIGDWRLNSKWFKWRFSHEG